MAAIYISTDKGTTYKNIFTEFNAVPCHGFYEALLTPVGVKEPITNTSRLEHGSRVITSSSLTKLKTNTVTLEIFISADDTDTYLSKIKNFIDTVRSGEIWLKVERLNTIFKLVYSECSKYGDFGVKRGKFALKFIEYNPNDRPSIS